MSDKPPSGVTINGVPLSSHRVQQIIEEPSAPEYARERHFTELFDRFPSMRHAWRALSWHDKQEFIEACFDYWLD